MFSCLCPTYNRAPRYLHLLEEAVASFLAQTVPAGCSAELLILNDTPGQELFCDEDRVTVVNIPWRFRTLGEKRNALAAMALGDVLVPWDDDDVSLPWRLSDAAAAIADGARYAKPCGYLYQHGGPVVEPSTIGYCHNCSAFTRDAFDAAGGYPFTSGDEDALMDARLRAAVGCSRIQRRSYVYRWGVSPKHVSGGPTVYAAIGNAPVARGCYRVVARASRDWRAECAQYAA